MGLVRALNLVLLFAALSVAGCSCGDDPPAGTPDAGAVSLDAASTGDGAVAHLDAANTGDGAVAHPDAANTGDGAIVEPDAANTGDGAIVEPDAANTGDGAIVEPDAANTGDGAVVELDAGSTSDDATPGADDATPGSDDATPGSDDATPGADDATPGADDATPGADDATPGADDATPGADDATVVVGNDAAAGGNDATVVVGNDAAAGGNDATVVVGNDAAAGGNDATVVVGNDAAPGGNDATVVVGNDAAPGADASGLDGGASGPDAGSSGLDAGFAGDAAPGGDGGVAPSPIDISRVALPNALLGVPYRAALSASGGVPPYAWSLSGGALPAGLTLGADGVIVGTPTTVGLAVFDVRATDSAAPPASAVATLGITVLDNAGSLQITTLSLAGGTVGAMYGATLGAVGGTPPYRWSVGSGALPSGITLSAAGVLSGVPTVAGTFSFAAQVDDSAMGTSSRLLTLVVAPPALVITTLALPDGTVGLAYAGDVLTSGGTPPIGFTIAGGSLPPGLSLDPATGEIRGVPTASGPFVFTVRASDASAQTAEQDYGVIIAASSTPLAISTTSLPDAVVGDAYSAALGATGGTPAYVWSVIGGALPAGLTLDSSGAISGAPTVAGTFNFTVRVRDLAGAQVTAQLGLEVRERLVLGATPLPDGVVGASYVATLGASGGVPAYVFSLASGALPPGLTLDPSGRIGGRPTRSGSFGFAVEVADAGGQRASASFTIDVLEALSITTLTLADGVVGRSYSDVVVAAGGTPPYTWSVGAGLPPGLALDTGTGRIRGIPSAPGAYSFMLSVRDSRGQVSSATLDILVVAPAALTITTSSLPNGILGQAYSAALGATGGTSPYTFSISAGALPAGLSLDPTSGAIAGAPTTSGLASFTVTVVDSATPSLRATRSLTILVTAALRITTASLGGGVVGTPYAASLGATGGSAPYAWSIRSGALPPGLTLDARSGAIGGTPSAAGTFAFTARVSDASGQAATRALSIAVIEVLTLTTPSAPNGAVGSAYSTSFAASGGTTPYAFSVSGGALPPGLTLSSGGVLSGTPTATGAYNFEVRVVDGSTPQQSATRSYSVFINGAGRLRITTSALPDGLVGTAYGFTLAASGGTPAYVWRIVGGALPPGLSMSASGVISGTPTAAGTFNVRIRVQDGSVPTQTSELRATLRVVAPLVISTAVVPGGTTGTAYSATLSATGGLTPYTWSVSAGALPAGLALDAASGLISGTPTLAGTYDFTIRVTDASSPALAATVALQIVVVPGIVITTQTLLNAIEGVLYATSLAATGGSTPYTWSLDSGALPTGLTLGANGTISGRATTRGTFAFVVRVTDASVPALSATASLSLTVTGPLTITTVSLPTGSLMTPYSAQFTASGGNTPYTWTLRAGSLPPGLSLSTGGLISGTPTQQGTFNIRVRVTDASIPSRNQDRSFAIQINNLNALTIATSSLPNGVIGSAYSATLSGSGGTPPYQWSIDSGALPPGLSLDPATGAITGVPSTAGNFVLTFRVTDAAMATVTRALPIVVAQPLVITTTSLPDGATGQQYTGVLSAVGGIVPYDWTLVGGSLPPGLRVDSNSSSIRGTPTAAGTYTFTIRVRDGSLPRQVDTQVLSITVISPLSIITNGLPPARIGLTYATAVNASGGTQPYVWSVSAGALPAGLTLDPATGIISGMPQLRGPVSFTIRVNDSGATPQQDTRRFTILVL